MRKQLISVVIFMLISAILLSSCGGGSDTPAAEEVVAEPTPTFTPDPKLNLDVFMEVLIESLENRDYVTLEQLIGTPFSLATVGSGSSSLPAAEVVKRLESKLLPEANTPVFLPDADLAPILGDKAPTSMGPALEVVRILYSQGWGEDGKGEAVLYVSKLPDNTFAWYGMAIAREGFNATAEEETEETEAVETAVEMDRTDLESFKQGLIAALSSLERTDETLLPLMNDPFIWSAWKSEGVELPLEEALPSLNEYLPAPDAIVYNAETDIAGLLEGQDPQAVFPAGVDFMHIEAWGADAAGEAILIIGQGEDGLYHWAGVLNAPIGFDI